MSYEVEEPTDDDLDINSLPEEIMLKIFGYMSQNQLGQIAQVCREWNALTKSPVLWRKVNVKIFCSSDKERNAVAKSFINRLPSCVTFIRLDFLERKYLDFKELCLNLHQNCPHAEEIILARCKLSTILPEVINFCTQFLQSVKKLKFHDCYFHNISRKVELTDSSKIEVLDLYYCDFSHFNRTQLSKLLHLQELRLNKTYVSDTWFVVDASFLNQLCVLDLGCTSITANTFLTIQSHGHNLKELYLCRIKLHDHDLTFDRSVDLTLDRSVFPHLKSICLTGTKVTCEGIVYFIQSCPSLENVYVDEYVAESFAEHPFVAANRCMAGIVKDIDLEHEHNEDYLQI